MAGQLIRRGENTWCVRVFTGRDDHGKRSYINQTVHGTKREADQELRKLLAQRDTGRLHVKPKQSVNDYLDVWLETVVRPSVRQRTLHGYDETLRLYVRPNLGRLRLTSVTPIEVRAMLVKLRDRGLGPRTVRKAHEVLRNALEQAVADCLIPENPARSRLVKKALPRTEREERQTIGVEAIGAFLAAAAENRLYAYWCVLLFGGLRPSEALALRWEDIRGDTVQVNRVLVDVERREMYFAPPKSKKSRRAVVLPTVAIEALREHRRRQAEERLAAGPAWEDQGLVFTSEVGGLLRQDNTRWHFRNVLKAAKLPWMRIYDLRHSNASLLLAAGEDLKVVSERLGHSTLALTADVYAHVSRGMQERAAGRLDGLVGGGGFGSSGHSAR